MKRGIWSAAAAYVMWGLFPLYWHALEGVPALELIMHRIIWSCLLLGLVLVVTKQGRTLARLASAPKVLGIYSVAAVLVSVNWFTYVWAVNEGFVVETSLGYFINPLISVLFGVVLLRERLRPGQWVAVGMAGSGVAYLTLVYGQLPWIALTLAVTFALYGLVKKLAPLNSVQGLALETGLLSLPAVAYVAFFAGAPGGALLNSSATTVALLVGAGVATTAPLLLFASASRRIPLVWIGLLQYIAPTIQFALGILVFHETMTAERLVGFSAVWLALAIFAVEGALSHRATLVPAQAE
jgi:chloramphenicol-sensitive protein RarD